MPAARDEERRLIELAATDRDAFRQVLIRCLPALHTYWMFREGDAERAESRALATLLRLRNEVAEASTADLPLPVFALRVAGNLEPNDLIAGPPTPAAGEPRTVRTLGHVGHRTASVLVLKFLLGYSFSEISTLLSIPGAAVEMDIYRAVMKLQRRRGTGDEG